MIQLEDVRLPSSEKLKNFVKSQSSLTVTDSGTLWLRSARLSGYLAASKWPMVAKSLGSAWNHAQNGLYYSKILMNFLYSVNNRGSV